MAVMIEKPKLVLVEGGTDKEFLRAMLVSLGLDDVQVETTDGKTGIPQAVKAYSSIFAFKLVTAFGVVRDADDDPEAAFLSVGSALKNAGLPVPPTVLVPTVSGSPRTLILIMPPDKPGELETLCLESVETDLSMPCIDDYFVCLDHLSLLETENMTKAKSQVYLARRRMPGLHAGLAAQKGYWDLAHPVFEPVRAFLQAL